MATPDGRCAAPPGDGLRLGWVGYTCLFPDVAAERRRSPVNRTVIAILALDNDQAGTTKSCLSWATAALIPSSVPVATMVRGASSSGRRTWAPCSSSMDSSTKASPSKAHLIVRDTSTAQDVPETDPLIPRNRYTAEASCQHLAIANVTPHAPTPPWEAAITTIVIARARSGVDSCRRPFVSRTG